MSERKVLNKYYPPEFDPSKIPKLRVKKTGIFSIRIMAPFNMRCNTCGEYIYKGKKFNSRKENVDDDDYLGLRIFRFYIRCPRCIAEIAFKTDLANTDYSLEAGATRLFEAEKLAHEMAEKERREKEEDELNPMKMLENRTKASRNEMEQLDQLEELKEMNARHARVDHNAMLEKHMAYEEQLLKLQEQEEDMLVKSILSRGNSSGAVIKRIKDDVDQEENGITQNKKLKSDVPAASNKASDVLVDAPVSHKQEKKESWQRSVGSFGKKTLLSNLVKKKTPSTTTTTQAPSVSSNSTFTATTQSTMTNGTAAAQKDDKKSATITTSSTTGLSLLGGYSDSEEDSS